MRAPPIIAMCLFGVIISRITHGGDPLEGRVICIDPGHGGTADTDSYRVGPTGEREEWIDLRVALMLRDILEQRGATVLMTRTEDVAVELEDRAALAVEKEADVFLSIHHNATADPEANFPIVYFHGAASENQASVALGRILATSLAETLFDGQTEVSLVSDHAIFPTAGAAVLRHSYGIAGVIGEASFFTNPDEEERLRSTKYNRLEAEAYAAALTEFFSDPVPTILDKGSLVTVEPFEVFEQAERMSPEAKKWRESWLGGKEAQETGTPESLERALELFTFSARAFPDSWIARDCHLRRAQILEARGRPEEAAMAQLRAEEHYVPLGHEFGIRKTEF
jgi:N-acetylmuramoyl-L-alanine amidase